MATSQRVSPDAIKPNAIQSDATIRPIGVYKLSGLAAYGQQLLAVDTVRGYLVDVCPQTDSATVLNPHTVEDWIDSEGLAVWENTVWFVRGRSVF